MWRSLLTLRPKPGFSLTTVLGAAVIGPIHKDVPEPPRQDIVIGRLYDVLADPPRVKGISPIPSSEQ